jgi:hypothetical protein
MIFGECPYCDKSIVLHVPDRKLPCFSLVECSECHAMFWEKFSRIDPECWTVEEFHLLFEINEETKEISKK